MKLKPDRLRPLPDIQGGIEELDALPPNDWYYSAPFERTSDYKRLATTVAAIADLRPLVPDKRDILLYRKTMSPLDPNGGLNYFHHWSRSCRWKVSPRLLEVINDFLNHFSQFLVDLNWVVSVNPRH
jgi:hypothetical protein